MLLWLFDRSGSRKLQVSVDRVVLLSTYLKLTFLAQLAVSMRAYSMDEDADYTLGGRQLNNRWRVHGYVDRRRRVIRSAEGEFPRLCASPLHPSKFLPQFAIIAARPQTHENAPRAFVACRAGTSYGRWYLQSLEPGSTPLALKYEVRGDDGASIALTLEKA
jgi:hypothetical protein